MALLSPNHRLGGSALLQAAANGEARIYAVFGGQGITENYFDEIRTVHSIGGQRVRELVNLADGLLQNLSFRNRRSNTYSDQQTLQLLKWLEFPAETPEVSLMVVAPISVPLIGILTLARYALLCENLGTTPGELRSRFKGTTGHSQGIIVAAVIASADSWEDFLMFATDAITILFWIGVRSQEWSKQEPLSFKAIETSLKHDEGRPTPMLSIRGLARSEVEKHVTAINLHLHEDHYLSISVINGPDNVVISGPPQSLCGLNARLRSFNIPKDVDQSRIPYKQRKPAFSHSFLPISAPFHSNYLEDTLEDIIQDVGTTKFSTRRLELPLYSTHSGEDLRYSQESNLVRILVRMIVLELLDWSRATTFPQATHVLDFGPGGSSGVGASISQIKQGSGLRVIIVSDTKSSDSTFGYLPEVLDPSPSSLFYETPWKDFRPRLFRDSLGRIHIDTRLSRLLALPSIMVAGLTPTTVHWDFVAATMNAGYHIELAGGGYIDANQMEEAINRIQDAVLPGRGITCNLIYASPRTITWQIPMIRSLIARGINIEGLTIGAGTPSPDVANEYIHTLGLKFIAFKPGSLDAIRQVINIAKSHPLFPIILQWTGGRGGGHHSAEDFHLPILQSYRSIRRCKNIYLVAGSGFGGAEDTYPYLTGEWSEKLKLPPMPFDGLLLGSRVMTAKEARTSTSAKLAIVNASGVDDVDWTRTYKGEAGGIISVISEMGQPIHKVATRGTRLWAEMDKMIFSLDRSKRLNALQKNRTYIMEKLDKDFQKPWFAKTASGVLVELEDLTYHEVLQRLIKLTYISHVPIPRWAHDSWKQLVQEFVYRIEQRFSSNRTASIFDVLHSLERPLTIGHKLAETYPSYTTEFMKTEDVSFFLGLCKRRGQKPVPFVPRLDEDFESWFKKDSLWQSEDIDAVVDQDVGRVCILQGPVAVRHSHVIDEPIKDILDGITNQHIEWLIRDRYGGSQRRIPTAEYFPSSLSNSIPAVSAGIIVSESLDREVFKISDVDSIDDIDSQDWFRLLAGKTPSWRQAAFASETLVSGKARQDNPIRLVFKPKNKVSVTVVHPNVPSKTVIFLHDIGPSNSVERARIDFSKDGLIRMSLVEVCHNETSAVMQLLFTFHPDAGYSLVREVITGRTRRVKEFYYRLWFGEDLPSTSATLDDSFDGGEVTLNQEMLQKFQRALGKFMPAHSKGIKIPLDFCIVIAWKALMKPIFVDQIDGDILKLVHLSNSFRRLPGSDSLREGDVVNSKSKITMLVNNESGRLVEVRATIYRLGTPVVELTTQFQYRGIYKEFTGTFQRKNETTIQMNLEDAKALSVLSAKTWFRRENFELGLIRTELNFDLETYVQYGAGSAWSRLEVNGRVTGMSPSGERVHVGIVSYEAEGVHGNPVMDYLTRLAKPLDKHHDLPNPVSLHGTKPIIIRAPALNSSYSEASGDYNPIHTSDIFARLAGLPGTITHGMYTSAAVRALLEEWVADNRTEAFRAFKCSFVGMVLPGDELEVVFEHVAMVAGRKIINVTAINRSSGGKVLQGQAEVDQPTTSYVFTGQGSQEKGMGMDLYESSPIARKIWDTADKVLLEAFGMSSHEAHCTHEKDLTLAFHPPPFFMLLRILMCYIRVLNSRYSKEQSQRAYRVLRW